MRRSIRQYIAGKPYDMAHNQSSMAIMYAFEDMQADIIALHRHLTELMAWREHGKRWSRWSYDRRPPEKSQPEQPKRRRQSPSREART
jgi:hypothetical protein